MGVWQPWGAACFLGGVLIVGTGLLLYYLETGRAILARWGNVPNALGWGYWQGASDLPSPTVVAATVVTVVNLLSVLAGAVILSLMLINLYAPQFTIDALLAKNLIFFFGHVFINTAIYMSVIAVYELLPRFSGRAWKLSGPFVLAWSATLLMVLAVYPHHTLMDFAMPVWANVMGQILSYTSALPVLAVTLVGTCAVVFRSRMRWSLVPALLFLSVFGWSAGVIPAVIDGTIAVNRVMHNTLWVPGHFHFYLLLGVVAMQVAFALSLARGTESPAARSLKGADGFGFWLFTVSGLGLAGAFLLGGAAGAPRRWAQHLAEWLMYDRLGTVFAVGVLLAAAWLLLPTLVRLMRPKLAKG
jgi:cytochrome c oxidase subunit 1